MISTAYWILLQLQNGYKVLTKIPFLLLLLGLGIFSCGKTKEILVGGDGKTSSEKYRVTVTSIPPTEETPFWHRLVQLEGPDVEGFKVEKEYSDKAGVWEYSGKTGMDGTLLDTDVRKKSRYRVGGELLTPFYEGAEDLYLSTGSINANQVIKAYRVFLKADQILTLGSQHLTIEADELVIDGTIQSYVPGSVGGGSAGKLTLKLRKLSGQGKIDLRGQIGTDGVDGAPVADRVALTCSEWMQRRGESIEAVRDSKVIGASGNSGTSGQDGGDGGVFEISAREVDRPYVLVNGGPGGAAGRGSKAGNPTYMSLCRCVQNPAKDDPQMANTIDGNYITRLAVGQCRPIIRNDGESFSPKAGSSGMDGTHGSAGKDGQIVYLDKL